MFCKDKLILVAGATGFVGAHFVRQLLDKGARVRATVHNRPLTINDPRIEEVQADLTQIEDCCRVAQGVDGIIHAAGSVAGAGVTGNSQMRGISTNLILTLNLLEAAWNESVDRFLLFSSSTGYPEADHPVAEEEMWTGPTHKSYLGYGWMRRYFERLGEFVMDRGNVKLALVRPTAIYGPGDNFDPQTCHAIPALIRKAVDRMAPFEVWGDGTEIRDNLHVSDLIRGSLMVFENHATGDPINIGYGKPLTMRDMVEVILKCAGHTNAELQFDASRPSTIPVRMVDTSKAKRVIGFEPAISFEDGIQETVDWFRAHHGAQNN